MPETTKSPGTETMPTVPGTETMPTLETLGREASEATLSAKPDRRPKLVKIDWNDECQRYCDELPLGTFIPAMAAAA
jgi:hypothetical protein